VQRSRNPTTDQDLITTSLFISLGTNLLGTGLMAVKGWFVHYIVTHRQKDLTPTYAQIGRKHARLMENLSFAKWKGEVIRSLFLLIETGAIWAAIQVRRVPSTKHRAAFINE
jgi:hypothetical protein